jgi:OOP family OmpA-OmpF porin
MKHIAALLILLVFCTTSFAQTKREWLKYADAAFQNGDYKNAVIYYSKAIDKTTPSDITHPYEAKRYVSDKKCDNASCCKKKSAANDSVAAAVAAPIPDSSKIVVAENPEVLREQYIVHQIAESYRLNRDYLQAEHWYKQSVKGNPKQQYPYENYWLGDAYMKNKNYAAANLQLDIALDLATEQKNEAMIKLAKAKIAGCYMGVDENSTEKGVAVTELDSTFNTGSSSFGANFYADENTLIFSTARDGNVVADPKKEKGKDNSDIYSLAKNEMGNTELRKVEGPVNTNQNEGAGFLSSDKGRFFFTRSLVSNKNECAIYFSRMFNGEWLKAQKMNDKVNLDGYRSTDGTIVPDGSIIYYSSNRPGGYGKMDIWYEFIDEEGRTYGDPINMGPLFNTPEDEVSPYFHALTNTLYFSSDGLAGFGGLDVFKSSLNKDDTAWSAPKNLGLPINSSKDDSYFVLDESQQKGYLTSDRKECEACTGGACYKLYSVSKEKNVYDIKGTVYNSETNAPVPNASITFKDIRSDWQPFSITTDSFGNYFFALKEGVELYMKAQKSNFLGDAGTVFTLGLTESRHFERDFFISPISAGNLNIPNVEFDVEMVLLRPAAAKILDNLAEVLKLNTDFKISIESYADIAERGTDKNNIQLSEQRSKLCFDYLVVRGIAPERMVTKAFGDTKLLVQKPQTEEYHQRKRRTTISLVK